jgi:outer membrane lipoprotein-sorting protein
MLRWLRISSLALLALPLSGCLFRSHNVERVQVSSAILQEATTQQLVQRVNDQAAQIKSVNATVDISPSVGGSKKGKVTEYTDIRGYILVRKPTMLRMIGLFPVVRNRAFDMVSDGQEFKVSIPPKNKFIIGRNDVTYPSQQGLEGVRPQYIMDALLLKPVDEAGGNEIAVLENGTEMIIDPTTHKHVSEANYMMTVVSKDAVGQWRISRRIYFSRENLEPTRQVLYDANGNIATDAQYEKYSVYGNVLFPAHIAINRPQEEYEILLDVVSAKFNTELTDAQFELPQPPGSQLVRLDLPPAGQQQVPQHPSGMALQPPVSPPGPQP